jgi:hypothetical protein
MFPNASEFIPVFYQVSNQGIAGELMEQNGFLRDTEVQVVRNKVTATLIIACLAYRFDPTRRIL